MEERSPRRGDPNNNIGVLSCLHELTQTGDAQGVTLVESIPRNELKYSCTSCQITRIGATNSDPKSRPAAVLNSEGLSSDDTLSINYQILHPKSC